MDQTLAFKYQFTHKSGRKYIAQSNAEFYALQMNRLNDPTLPEVVKNFQYAPWTYTSYNRLGYREFPKTPSKEQNEADERINKFWNAAAPARKLPERCYMYTGYFGSGVLTFLAGQANHAIMMGDEEGYYKARSLFPGSRNMLALPSPK